MIQRRKTSMIVTPNSAMGADLNQMSGVTWGEINKNIPLPNLQIRTMCLTLITLGMGMLITHRVEGGPPNTLGGLTIHYGDPLIDSHADHSYGRRKRVNLCYHRDRCVHRNL